MGFFEIIVGEFSQKPLLPIHFNTRKLFWVAESTSRPIARLYSLCQKYRITLYQGRRAYHPGLDKIVRTQNAYWAPADSRISLGAFIWFIVAKVIDEGSSSQCGYS